MSDKAIRTTSWIVGGIVFNVAFEVFNIRTSRIVPSLIGVILGEAIGEIIIKVRGRAGPDQKTTNDLKNGKS